MRILVFSDSHGVVSKMRDAIEKHPEAEIIVHLGDCERDTVYIEDLIGKRQFYSVCGNCDFSPQRPVNELIRAGDALVLCTHGHEEHVKYGTGVLEGKAKRLGAKVALYGHTHVPDSRYESGVYIFNPGSIKNGDFGAVDITPNGIMCINMNIG